MQYFRSRVFKFPADLNHARSMPKLADRPYASLFGGFSKLKLR
jgi:hypothetical protein